MKYVKILGLAVVAAMAVMAFVGAGTASATVLCATGTPEEAATCGSGKKEYSGNVEATSTNAILTNSITNVTCEHSATTIASSSSTGTPSIAGEVTALSFTGNCKTASGTACTVEVKNLNYPGTVTSLGGGESKLVVSDPEGAGAKVVCGFLINCTFTTKEATLTMINGSPSTAVASKVVLTRSGGFCPATAEWDATYSVTSPAGFTVL